MRDPVILQAALSHAAAHIDMVNNREPSKLAVMLTKEAIRMINERLPSNPSLVDNELIGAVAMIASNSVSPECVFALTVLIIHCKNLAGDSAESEIHMTALREMVRIKGGRDKLGDDGFIGALVSW